VAGDLPALRRAAASRRPAGPALLQQALSNVGVQCAAQGRRPTAPALAAPAFRSANPTLRAAAAHAQQLGKAHGWSPATIRCTIDGLTSLLDGRPAGERITLTEVRTRTPRHAPNPRVAQALADLGLLDDDTTLAVRAWIDRRAGELPAGFADAIRTWLLVLLEGDTRTGPARSPPSTSTLEPSGRSSSAGRPTVATSARSPLTTSMPCWTRCVVATSHRHRRATVAVPLRQEARPGLYQPHHAPQSRRGRAQPAADDRRRDPRRRTGRQQPRTAADRRPGRGPRRPPRSHPAPAAGRLGPAQPAHHHRRPHSAARRADPPCAPRLARPAPHRLAAHSQPARVDLPSDRPWVEPISKGYLQFRLQRHASTSTASAETASCTRR
jgi:hypothetical protein